jgi:hypothetical protein
VLIAEVVNSFNDETLVFTVGEDEAGVYPVKANVAILKLPEPLPLPKINILTVNIVVVVLPGAGIDILEVVVVEVPVPVTEPFVAVA